jgi:hypothetical protein
VIFWGELFAWLDFCLWSLLVDAGWIFLVHVVHFWDAWIFVVDFGQQWNFGNYQKGGMKAIKISEPIRRYKK